MEEQQALGDAEAMADLSADLKGVIVPPQQATSDMTVLVDLAALPDWLEADCREAAAQLPDGADWDARELWSMATWQSFMSQLEQRAAWYREQARPHVEAYLRLAYLDRMFAVYDYLTACFPRLGIHQVYAAGIWLILGRTMLDNANVETDWDVASRAARKVIALMQDYVGHSPLDFAEAHIILGNAEIKLTLDGQTLRHPGSFRVMQQNKLTHLPEADLPPSLRAARIAMKVLERYQGLADHGHAPPGYAENRQRQQELELRLGMLLDDHGEFIAACDRMYRSIAYLEHAAPESRYLAEGAYQFAVVLYLLCVDHTSERAAEMLEFSGKLFDPASPCFAKDAGRRSGLRACRAVVLLDSGSLEEAEDQLALAYAELDAGGVTGQELLVRRNGIKLPLARCKARRGLHAEAEALYREILDFHAMSFPPEALSTVNYCSNFINEIYGLRLKQGKRAEHSRETLKARVRRLQRLYSIRHGNRPQALALELAELWRGGHCAAMFDALETAHCHDLLHDLAAQHPAGVDEPGATDRGTREKLATLAAELDDAFTALHAASPDQPGVEREAALLRYDSLVRDYGKLRAEEWGELTAAQGLERLLPLTLRQALQLLPGDSTALCYAQLPEDGGLLVLLLREDPGYVPPDRSRQPGVEWTHAYELLGEGRSGEIIAARIPCAAAELRELVQRALAACAASGTADGLTVPAQRGALAQLYDVLLRPLECWLPPLSPAAADGEWQATAPWSLLVVPGAELLDVPWQALVRTRDASAAAATPEAAPVYLNDLASVRIVPSLSALRGMARQAQLGWAAGADAAADPADDCAQLRGVIEQAARTPLSFSRALLLGDSLAYVADETGTGAADIGPLPAVAQQFEYIRGCRWREAPRELLGPDATLANLLDGAAAPLELLMLSIHGEFNAERSEHSRLYFTPEPPELAQRLAEQRAAESARRGEDADPLHRGARRSGAVPVGAHSVLTPLLLLQLAREGRLTLRGLRELICDGCCTGRAGRRGGDDFKGLVAAWMALGVPNLLAGLFELHDGHTAELMQRYFACLELEMAPAAALRAAMRTMYDPALAGTLLQLGAHPQGEPYAWSGIQRYGVG